MANATDVLTTSTLPSNREFREMILYGGAGNKTKLKILVVRSVDIQFMLTMKTIRKEDNIENFLTETFLIHMVIKNIKKKY
jgi:hypothetical protein